MQGFPSTEQKGESVVAAGSRKVFPVKVRLGLLGLGLAIIVALLQVGCARRAAKEEGVVPPTQTPAEEPAKQEEATRPGEEKPIFSEEDMALSELKMVNFDFDRYDIRPQDAEILKANARILREHPQVRVRLEGHCDERGTTEYNFALGERRAQSVKEYLVDLGVSAGRLATLSYGEERPLDPASTEDAWARNRRVELIPQE
jgi:peptidoglycan-associated lipoprotein